MGKVRKSNKKKTVKNQKPAERRGYKFGTLKKVDIKVLAVAASQRV